jgi:predicted transcriptional regulator
VADKKKGKHDKELKKMANRTGMSLDKIREIDAFLEKAQIGKPKSGAVMKARGGTFKGIF